ncbi:MAG: hypothetical protein OIN66_15985 [Candidatus Methanoperedens sp.]|nr:hypothetical protein [Candidatus Methanoperedens sp.]
MKVPVNNISISDISTEQVRIPISGEISLLIGSRAGDYPSSRIQKGPVLIYRNKDLSEEGVGFGVPVLKFGHEAVFPGSRHVTAEKNRDTVVIKVDYDLNLVERMAIVGNKKIDSEAFYKIKEWFHGLHREHPGFRGILMPAFKTVSRICGVETGFDEVVSAGLVCVTYTIDLKESTVSISADISRVKKNGCSEVIILNEQGATCFDRYCDSNGISLTGEAIGTWDETSADEASFVDSRDGIKFTLKGIKGSRMFRGREFIKSRLAWSGLAYVLPPHAVHFAYCIHVGSARI